MAEAAQPRDPVRDPGDSALAVGRDVDVSVIIVSYECRDDLEQCLRAVEADTGDLRVEVLVVDNNSGDGTVAMVREGFPDITLIANEANVGFAAANNLALGGYLGRYAFLLNPDAFLIPGALGSLFAFMEANPQVGAVGPKLLNRDGSLQYSIRHFPSLTNAAFETLFLHRLFPKQTSRFGEVVLSSEPYAETHAVEWLSGAAMFVRRETIDRIGPLDESFFLFAEEVDWFKRMGDAGIEVYFLADATVIHRDSDGGVNPNLIGQGLYARDQYWRKHAGPVRARLAHWLLVGGLWLRILTWRAVAGLKGGERPNSQYRAYSRGLRDLRAGRSLARGGGE